MKRYLLWIMLVCLLPLGGAGAEVQRYAIRDLPAVTSPRWEQTYTAYGRTIQVSEEIQIPRVDSAPVLTVRAAPPVADTIAQELTAFCEKSMREDRVHSYSFASTAYVTAYDHATPPMWGKTRQADVYSQVEMGWDAHLLADYQLGAAYADNNPLLLGEAADIAQAQITALFPGDALYLMNAAMFDRTFYKATGKPISEKGYYHLEFHQVFHGIPYMGSVHSAFSVKAVGNEDYWLEKRGCASADVFDADAFLLACWFYQETGVLQSDIPLLPFDSVKGKVEALIYAGYVRAVDRVALGYVQFDTENRQEQLLLPAWVVWCSRMARRQSAAVPSIRMAGWRTSPITDPSSSMRRAGKSSIRRITRMVAAWPRRLKRGKKTRLSAAKPRSLISQPIIARRWPEPLPVLSA